jgi:thiamine biosynthesis protein ThiS
MQVLINGQKQELPAGCTVADLLADRQVTSACAVEVNKRLVPRRLHCEHALSEGDQVEIVSLVGGG